MKLCWKDFKLRNLTLMWWVGIKMKLIGRKFWKTLRVTKEIKFRNFKIKWRVRCTMIKGGQHIVKSVVNLFNLSDTTLAFTKTKQVRNHQGYRYQIFITLLKLKVIGDRIKWTPLILLRERQLSRLVKNRWVNLQVIEAIPEVKRLIMVLLEILILRNNLETKSLDLFRKKEANKSLNFRLNNTFIKGLQMKTAWVEWQMTKMVLTGHK